MEDRNSIQINTINKKGIRIQWHGEIVSYLKENGPQAILLIIITFVICFFCGLIELIIFLIFQSNIVLMADSAIYFLQSTCFALGAICISDSIESPYSIPPIVYKIAACVSLLPALILSILGIPCSLLMTDFTDNLSSLILSTISALACCFLAAILRISNVKKRVKLFIFGKKRFLKIYIIDLCPVISQLY